MRLAAAALAALVAVALGSCAGLPAPFQDAGDEAAADALAASKSPPGEQKAALARAQKRFAGDPSAANRLRLATLLVALPSPLHDDAKAAELLAPIADAGSPGTGRFAALLLQQVSERQHLAREIDRLTKDKERAERERAASDKERDKREEALRQQLEALRGIERGILEREDRLRGRQR